MLRLVAAAHDSEDGRSAASGRGHSQEDLGTRLARLHEFTGRKPRFTSCQVFRSFLRCEAGQAFPLTHNPLPSREPHLSRSSLRSSTWERRFPRNCASPNERAFADGPWSKHSFAEQGISKWNLGTSSMDGHVSRAPRALECSDLSELCGGCGLVRAAGACASHPRSTPSAAASCLLPQSADKSAQSKASSENHPGCLRETPSPLAAIVGIHKT